MLLQALVSSKTINLRSQVAQGKRHSKPKKMKRAVQSLIKVGGSHNTAIPSIPTDLLGYKENNKGQLVKIQSQVNRLAVGPGAYEIQKSGKNSHVLNWSHSKAEENGRLFTHMSSNSFVGPGAYDVKDGLVTSTTTRPVTSSFKSKSNKVLARPELNYPTPGPGYYNQEQSPFLIIPQQTHFGSKTARFADKRESSPGPADYSSRAFKLNMGRKKLPSAPFNSSTKKAEQFKPTSKIGPGSYNPPKYTNPKATIIGFQERFFDNRGTTAPGPGTYTTDILSRPKTTAMMHRQTIPLIKKEQTVAPTATSYTVDNFSIGKKSMPSTAKSNTNHSQQTTKHPFNTSAERFYKRNSKDNVNDDQSELRAAIGKLTDKHVIRETTYDKLQVPFNSTAERVTAFQPSKLKADPNAYLQPKAWIKPSFNIKSSSSMATAKK